MLKKRNIRSRVPDVLVILICLFGVILNIRLFWKDLNRTMTRLNEKPIATISFKYKSAQRKFIDRVIWDRLQQESPVYNGDTIRTAELSEATIIFPSGEIIELFENSLAQIFVSDTGAFIDFGAGDISVNTQNARGTTMVLSSGGNRVEVAAGGVINAGSATAGEGGGQEFMLRVLEGTANFDSAAGNYSASAGSVFNMTGSGELRTEPAVSVSSPLPGTRLLNNSRDPMSVDFVWQNVNFTDERYVRLEVSEDRNFTRVVQSVDISGARTASVDLPSGIFWWRMYPIEYGEEGSSVREDRYLANAASGRLMITYAPAPQLIAPAVDYEYSYCSRLPAVRFLWSSLDQVSSYLLEAADNPEMDNPLFSRRTRDISAVYQGLGAGTWYWRITPVYSDEYAGSALPSGVQTFVIRQSGSLYAPELLLPEPSGFVNIARNRRDVYFSWKNDTEAVSYTIQVSRNENLSDPVLQQIVTENWFSYNADRNIIRDGQYYWGVYLTDMEGNRSPVSDVRSFLAMEGEVIHRTIFPPDNYTIADARLPDLRFTWRTNLPFQNRFQVSNTPDFSVLLFDDTVSTSSAQGLQLPLGEYYWRLVAVTGSESVNFVTAPKRFATVPPLAASEGGMPSQGIRVVVRENEPVEFNWEPVPLAEYYHFKLYSDEDSDRPVFENPYVEGTSLEVSMDDMEDGIYNWSIQAFTNESSTSSRRSGLLASFRFSMKRLRPVVLESPAEGYSFDGLTAIRNPGTVTWSSVDVLRTSRFVLSSSQDIGSSSTGTVMDIADPGTTIQLIRLSQGTWFWTVFAETVDGLDVSAPGVSWFTVQPIPPLPSPGGRLPADQYVIGPDDLMNSRNIVFRWNSVAGANAYVFSLFHEPDSEAAQTRTLSRDASRELLLRTEPLPDNSFTLEDLSILDRGTFMWRVEAVFTAEDGYIEQPGIAGENRFIVDIPQPSKPQVTNPGPSMADKRFSAGLFAVLFFLSFRLAAQTASGTPAPAEGDVPAETAAEKQAYYIEETEEGWRFIQMLEWPRQSHVRRYEIIVERQDDESREYTEFLRESVETNYIEISIPAGEYRYRLVVYNLLNRADGESDWLHFSVFRAIQPELENFAPRNYYLDETFDRSMVLSGDSFVEGAEIFLIEQDVPGEPVAGDIRRRRKIFPVEKTIDSSQRRAEVVFGDAMQSGSYDVVVQNPGGLWSSAGTLTVKFQKPVDFNISAGYAPMILLYGSDMSTYFEKRFYPLGANIRMSLVPIKKTYGYFGFEIDGYWNFIKNEADGYTVSTHLIGGHFNLLYQKPLIPKRLVLNVRAGGGVFAFLNMYFDFGGGLESEPLNTWFPTAGGGLSLQWFVFKRLYADLGVTYMHFFSKEMPSGYLLPVISVGWQF
ncbi:hypothetical protein K7I13_13535 [Brucepastera parasyntrophica]|uniref:hypothetical protein n=1 Tax=Brucepastera parasyntrophica TaxID=2880008 RepID=UPI002108F19D|nr:hypothetical protein [Brucepastera parasyntrophica]ULQ59478.1 hypothetical protein K7I13_13535 [Brucepastera parasyntrophica]